MNTYNCEIQSAGKFSMEDFESVGIINGVPAHDFNVDGIEDKPWRIPGADITDYFNYGYILILNIISMYQVNNQPERAQSFTLLFF